MPYSIEIRLTGLSEELVRRARGVKKTGHGGRARGARVGRGLAVVKRRAGDGSDRARAKRAVSVLWEESAVPATMVGRAVGSVWLGTVG